MIICLFFSHDNQTDPVIDSSELLDSGLDVVAGEKFTYFNNGQGKFGFKLGIDTGDGWHGSGS